MESNRWETIKGDVLRLLTAHLVEAHVALFDRGGEARPDLLLVLIDCHTRHHFARMW